MVRGKWNGLIVLFTPSVYLLYDWNSNGNFMFYLVEDLYYNICILNERTDDMKEREVIFRPYVKVYYGELNDMEHKFSSEYRIKFSYDHLCLNYGHVKYFLDEDEVYGFIEIRKEKCTDKLKRKLRKYIPYNFTIKQSLDDENELSLVFTGKEFLRLYHDLTKRDYDLYEKGICYKLISPVEEKYHDLEWTIFSKLLKGQRNGIDYVKLYSYGKGKIDLHVFIVGLSNKTERYKEQLKQYITEKLSLEDYEPMYYNPNTSKEYNRINVLYYKDIDIERIYDLETLTKMKGL